MSDGPRGFGGKHGSLPPPAQNAGVLAWGRAGRALDELERVEKAIKDAEDRLEGSILRLGGELSKKIREVDLKTRRSGHDLREVKEDLEDSKVTNLARAKEDLVRQLARAREDLEELNDRHAKERRAQGQRAWDLFKALLLLVAGGLVTWFFGHQPPIIH